MDVEQALTRFFSDKLHESPPDPEIVTYIAEIILDPDEDIDSLREAIGSFSTSFPDVSYDDQTQLLLELKASTQPTAAQPSHHTTEENQHHASQPAAGRSGSALAEAFSRLNTLSSPTEDATSTSSRASSSCSFPGTSYRQPTTGEEEAISVLKPLCPDAITDAFLLHALRDLSNGDVAVAAAWLTDHDADILTQQETWQRAEQRKQEERAEEAARLEAANKRMLDKYKLQAVTMATTESGAASKGVFNPKAPAPMPLGPKGLKPGGDTASKLRYRDGVVVAKNGEKVIIEKLTEEWDGGSRGRVKSKRKGGVGWH